MITAKRIQTIADFLHIDPSSLTLGEIGPHHVSITTGTAEGYIGLQPTKKLLAAIVRDRAVYPLDEITPASLTSARALIVRNDSIPHVNICLCDANDIEMLDKAAEELLGERTAFGREYPDCIIERHNARVA